MSNFNIKLKDIRTKKGIKQVELGELLSIPQQRISEYENGKVIPSLERLVEFAQILDVGLDDLIEFKRIQNKLSEELNKK